MNNVLAQLIGAIGYITLMSSYYKKEKRDILFTQIFSTIAFGTQYYLLNGITGTVCNAISLTIIIAIYFFEKNNGKNKKILILVAIPLLVLISLLTYENIFSIFPIIASTIILTSFLLSNENTIRIAGILSASCWFIYAVIYKSYVGMIFELITITTTIIAFCKNIKKE